MLQKKKSVSKDKSFILWFEELGNTDVAYVGGKNASLGEMYRLLSKKGIRIPNGFAITSYAYRYVIKNAGIREEKPLIFFATKGTKNQHRPPRNSQSARKSPLPLRERDRVRGNVPDAMPLATSPTPQSPPVR